MTERQKDVLLRLAKAAKESSDSPSIHALSDAIECMAYSDRWTEYDLYIQNNIPYHRFRGFDMDDIL